MSRISVPKNVIGCLQLKTICLEISVAYVLWYRPHPFLYSQKEVINVSLVFRNKVSPYLELPRSKFSEIVTFPLPQATQIKTKHAGR